MRTTLELDDDLMEALVARHPDLSKTRAVETAIREYLARDAALRLIEAAGTVDLEDHSDELRRIDRHT